MFIPKHTIYSFLPQNVRRFSVKRSPWISTVGLEVHVQILSKTKLFSSSEINFAARANDNVNLFDAAIPGTLPVLNKKCVELAVLTSLALECQINTASFFDRKHYFYADLPSGYQITQQRSPLSRNGSLNFYVFTPGMNKVPYRKSCRLKQIQLEQDSGKSLHDVLNRKSLIDLNRAGVGLMEFVFEPELKDGEEAAALIKELILILERVGSCSCRMEEGGLRVDANVSISNDPDKLGVRTEVKNIGSVRGVANAVEYEIERQISIAEKGGTIVNETRNWDPELKQTISMRDKEETQDYRFMPEPNLPPVRLSLDGSKKPGVLDVSHLVNSIPELPESSRQRLVEEYKFSDAHAYMMMNQPRLYDHFLEIMKKPERNAKVVWNVLLVQFLNVLHKHDLEPKHCKMILAPALGQVVDLVQKGKIDYETCREILNMKVSGDSSTPEEIVRRNNWYLVSYPERIEFICNEVIKRNPKAVKKAKNGKDRALQTLINDVANITKEKINLSLLSKRLKEIIKKEDKDNE